MSMLAAFTLSMSSSMLPVRSKTKAMSRLPWLLAMHQVTVSLKTLSDADSLPSGL
jgi:hypothetical protein